MRHPNSKGQVLQKSHRVGWSAAQVWTGCREERESLSRPGLEDEGGGTGCGAVGTVPAR